ncbi:MAG: FAD-dependent oxidoreductase, partial [Hyphomicrobiales bacterium]
AQYTTELYKKLQAETGQATSVRQNGSLSLALNEARFEELKRGAAMGRLHGLEAHVLGPGEIAEIYPALNLDGALGGLLLPGDGQGDPVGITQALIKGARQNGASIFEGVKVTGILSGRGRVTGVATDQGTIQAEYVVNCAGLWGREVGRMAGVSVPLMACEHFYIVTEPMPAMTPGLPVLRVPDEHAYYKEDAGKLLLGCFEPVAKPWGVDGIPEDFAFGQLPEDFEHFEPILERAVKRLPALATTGIHTFFNGPESFTPDNRYLLGEAPELRNFYVACGFNSVGIQSAGGAGNVLAQWMDQGHPPCDLWDDDIARMQPFQSGRDYLVARVRETLGLLYAVHWPYYQYQTSRGMRHSPLHHRLAGQGACFGEVAGWERANWFAAPGEKAEYQYSYQRQNWFAHAAGEHAAVRNGVGLFDMSSFAKFRVEGPDAPDFMNFICANDVDVEPGRVVYTQWLNQRGGIEADLTVARLSQTAYLVVSAAASQTRDLAWLRRHLAPDDRVTITDNTSGSAVLALMGPGTRALLAEVSDADLSNNAFAFATWQEITVGMAPVRAQRITYVGELGWELYIGADFAEHVFDTLLEAGQS